MKWDAMANNDWLLCWESAEETQIQLLHKSNKVAEVKKSRGQ
jgi:hypothetical protein